MTLTGKQMEQLQKALISAFPQSSALEQMVFFELGENLVAIAGGTNHGVVVFNLITWAVSRGKIDQLLEGAQRQNPDNPQLKAFLQEVKSAGSAGGTTPTSGAGVGTATPETALRPELRKKLVDILMRSPTSNSFLGRDQLLIGIPARLNRNEASALSDLTGIVVQLNELGQLSSGDWPLLLLIDNALPYVEGFRTGEELKAVRQELVRTYGVAEAYGEGNFETQPPPPPNEGPLANRSFSDAQIQAVVASLAARHGSQSSKYLSMEELLPELDRLFDRQTFRFESLYECTTGSWMLRLSIALQTLVVLEAYDVNVRELGTHDQVSLYKQLRRAVEGYCMRMESCLFKPRPASQVNIDLAQHAGTPELEGLLAPRTREFEVQNGRVLLSDGVCEQADANRVEAGELMTKLHETVV